MALTTFYLAPNAKYQLRDLTGQPAQFGKLYTYKAGTVIPWPTYSDPAGQNENLNPVEFDERGEADIYWKNDVGTPQLYYIRAYDANEAELYDQDNYPTQIDTAIPPIPDEGDGHNFVRNPQFSWWSNTGNFQNYSSVVNANAEVYNSDCIADDWFFYRNNTNATINITRVAFDYGQTIVPANPKYYSHYECNNVGAGAETQKFTGQTYLGAQTLAGEEVSIAFWAKSSSASIISVSLIQFFGSGGSPSPAVNTNVQSFTLTNNWVQYTAKATIPLVNGKNPGSDGNDALILAFNMPLNSIGSVDLCNAQMQQLSEPTAVFPYNTQNEQFLDLSSQISNAVFKTGDHKTGLSSVVDPGFILCDDLTIGNSASNAAHAFWGTKALFQLLWDTVPNQYAPIFNSDGTSGTRGASAELDYFANKSLALTKTVGRVLATAGQAVLNINFVADPGADTILIPGGSSSFYTGTPVTVSTTGTLPSPLLPATTYYVGYVGPTELQLYATLSASLNLLNPINITTVGTGVQTITINYENWTPGQYAGEIGHSLSTDEESPHIHSTAVPATNEGGECAGSGQPVPAPTLSGYQSGTPQKTNATPSGYGLPHNNMQPTIFLYTQVKL